MFFAYVRLCHYVFVDSYPFVCLCMEGQLRSLPKFVGHTSLHMKSRMVFDFESLNHFDFLVFL